MSIGKLAVLGLAIAFASGGVGAALNEWRSADPGASVELASTFDGRKDDALGIALEDDDDRGDGDATRGDDGTNGGDNTGDGDATRGNDGTNGGDNTGDGDATAGNDGTNGGDNTGGGGGGADADTDTGGGTGGGDTT